MDVEKPLKIKKVNIGSKEQPKFSNVRDYWDEETVSKITKLLQGYQELFPTKLFRDKDFLLKVESCLSSNSRCFMA